MSLAERLAARLAESVDGLIAGDDVTADDLAGPRDPHEPSDVASPREAAVLVAVTDRLEPGVLLTVRHADLRSHGGQIAFPGGKVDPDDRDPAHTALREAWEEIGLDPGLATVCGLGDRYRTVSNFVITPVVAVVPPDCPLRADPREVEEWFEAPLAFVLDPANQQRKSLDFRGRTRTYFEIVWDGRRIWGATAAMLVNLSRRLRWV